MKRFLTRCIKNTLVMAGIGLSSVAFAQTAVHSSAAQTGTIVNVSTVQKKDIPQAVDAVGTLSAIDIVTVSSESDGRIAAIHFKNGQEVASGMPIIQLDDSQAQADYHSAITALQLAQQKYSRSKLVLNTAVSQQDLAALKAAVATAQATVQSKFATLNQKKILAPFTGVLGAFSVNVGDYVSAGTALVKLVNTEQLRASYHIAEVYLPKLKKNQSVIIKVNAYPKKTFYGTVTFISPTVDTTTRTVLVQALVSNKKGLLSPGMFAQMSQQVAVVKNAMVAPDQAVLADVKGYYVFLVKNGKAVKVYVTVGQRTGEWVQVLKGLKLGDTVVTAGQQKLHDGSQVIVKSS